MVGIAADLMSIHNSAQNANASKEEKEEAVEQHLPELQLLEAAVRVGLEMGTVMMATMI